MNTKVPDIPSLESEVTVLRPDRGRSPAVYQIVVNELFDREGDVYWIDARNAASSYALFDIAPSRELVADINVARAFTAYQHHSIIQSLPELFDEETDLLIVPNIASLYRDSDVTHSEGLRLLKSAMAILTEIASVFDTAVLVSTLGDDSLLEHVVSTGDRVLESRQTEMGIVFEGDAFETQIYWQDGYWQTTIPYWAELLGTTESLHPHLATSPPVTVSS